MAGNAPFEASGLFYARTTAGMPETEKKFRTAGMDVALETADLSDG